MSAPPDSSRTRVWHLFRSDEPGRRFQNLYRRRHETQPRAGKLKTIFTTLAGGFISVLGIILMPAPGPGLLVFVIGLGLLASEYAVVAGFLDSMELKIRAAVERIAAARKDARRKAG